MTVRRPPKLVKAGAKAKKKQTAKPTGNKARLAAGRKDALATTPTNFRKTSPDYVKQKGDPNYLRKYSEEQIGLLGGRDRMATVIAARKQHAATLGMTKSYKDSSIGKVAPWENLDAPTGTLLLGKPEKEEGAGDRKKKPKKGKSKGRGGRSQGSRKGQTIRTNKPRRTR